MLTLLGAKTAATSAARGERFRFNWPLLAIAAAALSGCMPATTTVTTADPAAKVARVDYRATIAPYTSLRPAAPASWRERNDDAAPQPKQGQ